MTRCTILVKNKESGKEKQLLILKATCWQTGGMLIKSRLCNCFVKTLLSRVSQLGFKQKPRFLLENGESKTDEEKWLRLPRSSRLRSGTDPDLNTDPACVAGSLHCHKASWMGPMWLTQPNPDWLDQMGPFMGITLVSCRSLWDPYEFYPEWS